MISIKQKTINKTIKLSGVGLHNGVNADLVIKPAEDNFGINFCRVDIDKNDLIKADFKNVVEQYFVQKFNKKTVLQFQPLNI